MHESPTSPRRARLVPALVLFVALTLVAAVLLATRTGPSSDLGGALGRASGDLPAPTISAAPVTVPTLPIPEALPENPYEDTPQVVLGTIEIPKIDLVDQIQHGVTLTAINRGPGWWPGTAMPGGLGNAVIAGHRTTYNRPFYRLNELETGDQVILTTDSGRFVYEVRGVIVVPEEWIDIAAQSYAHTATLFACHPPGSARERIVAKLRLLDSNGRPVDADSALPAMDAEAQRTDHTLVVRDRTTEAVPAGVDPLSASGG
jgi:LPXTG-site transpeptidase (sortase) family protein